MLRREMLREGQTLGHPKVIMQAEMFEFRDKAGGDVTEDTNCSPNRKSVELHQVVWPGPNKDIIKQRARKS